MNFFVDNNNNIMWEAGPVIISLLALIMSGYSIVNTNKQGSKNRKAQLTLKRRVDALTDIKQAVLNILKTLDEMKVSKNNFKQIFKKIENLDKDFQQLTSTLNAENEHTGNFSGAISKIILRIISKRSEKLNYQDVADLLAETRIELDMSFRRYELLEEKEINNLL